MAKSVGLFHIPESYGDKWALVNDLIKRHPTGACKIDLIYVVELLKDVVAHPENWIPANRMIKAVRPCVVCETEYYMPEKMPFGDKDHFYNKGYCSPMCSNQ